MPATRYNPAASSGLLASVSASRCLKTSSAIKTRRTGSSIAAKSCLSRRRPRVQTIDPPRAAAPTNSASDARVPPDPRAEPSSHARRMSRHDEQILAETWSTLTTKRLAVRRCPDGVCPFKAGGRIVPRRASMLSSHVNRRGAADGASVIRVVADHDTRGIRLRRTPLIREDDVHSSDVIPAECIGRDDDIVRRADADAATPRIGLPMIVPSDDVVPDYRFVIRRPSARTSPIGSRSRRYGRCGCSRSGRFRACSDRTRCLPRGCRGYTSS